MRSIVALVFAFGLSGCGVAQLAHSVDDEKALVPSFHDRLNHQSFAALYSSADKLWRDSITRAKSDRFFSAIHRKLGDVLSTSEERWNVNVTPKGTFVTLGYKTTFRKGEATETFVFHREDKSSRLAGYHINSEALITN